MVQPVAASPSCIQSYSPCSLISDLIQRVADCVSAIFNAIAYFVTCSFCFGAQAPSPALPPVAAPARPIPPPASRLIPPPAYNPLQMIAPSRDLDVAASPAAVENGTRFLLDQLRVLQQTDCAYYNKLITKLETHPNPEYVLSQFLTHYFISAPSVNSPVNDQVLDLRARFAALSEEESAVAMENLKKGTYWSSDWTAATREFMDGACDLSRFSEQRDVFSTCAKAAQRELVAAGEIIDPEVLMEEGVRFLLHEYTHTDARQHQGLLGRFDENESGSFYHVIVYHLIFPATVVRPSAHAIHFLNHLMQTRAAKAFEERIGDMRATFNAFSEAEQTNALEAWRYNQGRLRSTLAFNSDLWQFKGDFSSINFIAQCASKVRNHLRSEGL